MPVPFAAATRNSRLEALALRLFIAESLDGIEASGTGSGIKTCGEAHENGEGDGTEAEPPGNRRNIHTRKILTMQVEIGAECESPADEPTKKGAENAAEKAHDAGFDEEKLLDVAVGSAEGFQDTNFAAAFEDGHDERVDDAERGDGKREAAEDTKKKIEHGKKDAQALGSIEKRERAEAHVFDGGFEGFDVGRALGADGEAGVRGFGGGGAANDVAKIVDLRGAKSHGNLKGNEQAAVAVAAETGGGLGVHNTDDAQAHILGHDGEAAGQGIGTGGGGGVRIRGIWRAALALGATEDESFAHACSGLWG